MHCDASTRVIVLKLSKRFLRSLFQPGTYNVYVPVSTGLIVVINKHNEKKGFDRKITFIQGEEICNHSYSLREFLILYFYKIEIFLIVIAAIDKINSGS